MQQQQDAQTPGVDALIEEWAQDAVAFAASAGHHGLPAVSAFLGDAELAEAIAAMADPLSANAGPSPLSERGREGVRGFVERDNEPKQGKSWLDMQVEQKKGR